MESVTKRHLGWDSETLIHFSLQLKVILCCEWVERCVGQVGGCQTDMDTCHFYANTIDNLARRPVSFWPVCAAAAAVWGWPATTFSMRKDVHETSPRCVRRGEVWHRESSVQSNHPVSKNRSIQCKKRIYSSSLGTTLCALNPPLHPSNGIW